MSKKIKAASPLPQTANRNLWTSRAEKVLCGTWGVLPTRIISLMLARTESAIISKASRMGLRSRKDWMQPFHFGYAGA